MKVPVSISVDEEIVSKLKKLNISPSQVFSSLSEIQIRKRIAELISNALVPISLSIVIFYASITTKSLIFLISFAAVGIIGILYAAFLLYEIMEVRKYE